MIDSTPPSSAIATSNEPTASRPASAPAGAANLTSAHPDRTGLPEGEEQKRRDDDCGCGGGRPARVRGDREDQGRSDECVPQAARAEVLGGGDEHECDRGPGDHFGAGILRRAEGDGEAECRGRRHQRQWDAAPALRRGDCGGRGSWLGAHTAASRSAPCSRTSSSPTSMSVVAITPDGSSYAPRAPRAAVNRHGLRSATSLTTRSSRSK